MANNKRIYQTLTTLSIIVLMVSGCGNSTSQNQDQVATAVAQTVQAQDSLTKVANISVPTSAPTLAPANGTPEALLTSTAAPEGSTPSCTLAASLISENPPDGAILKPGDTFLKTWTIKNIGTCRWDQSFKFIYWSGDLMDGLTSYSLPDEFAPDEQKDISIFLKAPADTGTYTGYWKIQAPWGASFGVGQYSEPIYVQVIVSTAKHPTYDVTSVEFSLVRDPETGCPPNVLYTLTATISTSGPLDLLYHWNASGSLFTHPKVFSFTAAETKTLSYTLGINKQSTKPTDYWILFTIDDPKGHDFKKVYVNYNC